MSNADVTEKQNSGNSLTHDAEGEDQYLTFIMDREEYGVDILSVQEIRGWETATPIPNSPKHVRGVINLRGTIVPLIDLRLRFGLPAKEYSQTTVVIVLKVPTKSGKSSVMGIVVDAVSDVYSLSNDALREAPDLGENVNTDYIKGLANVNGKMVILLEISKFLNVEEIADIKKITSLVSTDDVPDAAAASEG